MNKWYFVVVLLCGTSVYAQNNTPREWIDPATGHRVIRLSETPGSSTFYFHDPCYTPEGDKLVFNTSSGVAVMDITKLGSEPPKLDIVTNGSRAIMARRSREVYVQILGLGGRQPAPSRRGGLGGGGGGPIYAVNIDTKAQRLIPNAVSTVISCDESWGFVTVRGDAAIDPSGKTPVPATRPVLPQLGRMFPGKKMEDLTPDQQYAVTKEDGLAGRAVNPGPQAYTFINLKTGERKTTGFQYGDLNHQQFNPVDPTLLLYAHEGTWHEVQRTWNIRTDGSGMKLMHKRSMDMEINGHEWWNFDGKTVWFDLQTPRSQDFWIAGVNIDTGKETRYHLQREWWGVHFNSSRDDTLFASDGGDPTQVAFCPDGMWINLFRVQPDGTLAREKLFDMSKHNYVTGRGGVEPNCSITPDKKWVIFTGQLSSNNNERHVYAVEIAKH